MAADGAASGGLAPISTTDTGGVSASDGRLEVVSALARWKRLRKGVREAARLHEDELRAERSKFYRVMVRLSYAGSGRPESEGGDARPSHVSDYLKAVREWARRLGFRLRYVWVGELQERGALHYHVVFWLPKRVSMPFSDRRGWWRHGSTNKVVATSPIGYLTKYISKLRSKGGGQQHRFPKGFRMHGSGGLSGDAAAVRRFSLFPKWLRESGSWLDRFKPVAGGGWVSRLSGEWLRSPWVVLFVERRPGAGAVVHIGRRLEVGA